MSDSKVEIDAELEPLIPGYLKNQQENLKKMLKALDEGDFEALRVLGHNLKGSGGGYGFDRLSEIGAEIEEAGKKSDASLARSQLVALEDYLSNVQVAYV